jgi:hypothetical protein
MHRTRELSIHVVLFDGHRWHVNLIEDVFAGPRRSTRELSRKTFTSKSHALDYLNALVADQMDEVADRSSHVLPAAAGPRGAAGKAQQYTA